MKKFWVFFLLFLPTALLAEEFYPLTSLDAHLLSKNRWELRVGIKYLHDRWFLFEGKDTNRREVYLPEMNLNVGLANNVEMHLHYFFLYLDDDTDNEWGSGDLTLGMKINLLKEDTSVPAISLNLSTKLPNANYKKRLGTDETDFFGELLLAKQWNAYNLFFNIGLGILGNPKAHNQDDVMICGLGLRYRIKPNLNLLTEINGFAFSRKNNKYAVFTIGGQYLLSSSWRVDTGIHFGLTKQSEDWGISFGIAYIWQW